MEEKILKIREEIINKLNKVEEGIHIKLNYESRINEAILFKTGDNESPINQFGNRKQCAKYFAIPFDLLKKIDFSNIDFTNFNALGFDFNGLYNVKLNPQTLWKKNLMGAKLNGVEFIGPFDDATLNDMKSNYITDFTGSKGAIIDVSKINRLFDEWVFLNNCIFNGVTFTSPFKILDYVNQSGYRRPVAPRIIGSDFTGSKGAIIYPNEIEYSLEGCILTDTILATPVNVNYWLSIKGTDFTGSKQKGNFFKKYKPVEIILSEKTEAIFDFTNTVFNGVRFSKPLDKPCFLNKTDFTNSIGAVIDLKKIDEKSNLDSCNFTDSIVFDIDGTKRLITEDGKLSHDFVYELDEAFGIKHSEKLAAKEELENARLELIKKKREDLYNKIKEVLNLTKSLETLGIEPNHLYGTIPITEELLLVKVDDHLEINRDIIDASLIRFFNLSLINFTNVKITGIDFCKSKAKIDPQIVYHKDISNCKFDDFNISPFTNLDNVIMNNTDFSECSFNPKIKTK